jgi:hypothetical protein
MEARRDEDASPRDRQTPALGTDPASLSSRSAAAVPGTRRGERTPRVEGGHRSAAIAPHQAVALGAPVAPNRASQASCALCGDERLVVIAHVSDCLKAQWFDGRTATDCAETCLRADCPACHPAALAEGSVRP